MSQTMPAPCISASHAVLFESDEDRCSVCAELLVADDEEAQTLSRGRGLLVWSRGDERRCEEPELCPRCASAIGVTALHRWELDEDEG
jgi:hypothetical protein